MLRIGILYIIFSCSFVFCQSVYDYQNAVNYSVNEGLPSSQVYDMIQTADGYMWFATDRGLCRFNGINFERFTTADGLVNNVILNFHEQENGEVWCSTLSNKLFKLDEKSNFPEYQYNDLVVREVGNGIVSQVYVHEKEVFLGFSTHQGYLKIGKEGKVQNTISAFERSVNIVNEHAPSGQFTYRLEAGKVPKQLIPNSEMTLQPTNDGNRYSCIKLNDLLIFNDDQKVYLRKGNEETIELGLTAQPIGLGKLNNAYFWVSFRGGGFRIYSRSGKEIGSYLSPKWVTSVYVDHEHGCWVSTLNSGVFYYRNNDVHVWESDEETTSSIVDITVTDKNELFVGYYNGNVMKWSNDNYSLFWKSQLKNPAHLQYYREKNEVLINSGHRTFFESDLKSFAPIPRSVIAFDDNPNHTPAYAFHNGISVFKEQNNELKLGMRVLDVSECDTGYYLACTDGLYFYSNGSVRRDKRLINESRRFNDIDDFNGKLFLASLGDGVFVLDKNGYFKITEKDGLFSNSISQVYVENDSVLWACTNRGVNRITFRKGKKFEIVGVSYIDGLPSNETSDIGIIGDRVWVGTSSGLAYFKKTLFDQNKGRSNHFLSLLNVHVNGDEFDPKRLADLQYFENDLTLYFQAISFKESSSLVYRYKLEGFDNRWRETKQPVISYTSLPPGDYTLIMQVSGQSGKFSENSFQLEISVARPFYKTWWFFLLIFGSVFGIIYMFFKLYILTYNRDVVRELLRVLIKRFKRKSSFVTFRIAGKDTKINTVEIIYVQANGNYLTIHTDKEKYVVRCKIGDFEDMLPDSIEFLRIHRSYIVRIDRVTKKSSKSIFLGDVEIPITKLFKEEIKKVQF